jgi:hypothetical protein
MKASDADVVWVPRFPREWYEKNGGSAPDNEGSVRVERHLSGWKRTKGDRCSPAANLGYSGARTEMTAPLAVFILFNTLVVRDGIEPAAAHRAFLEIDEYRQHISREKVGAR